MKKTFLLAALFLAASSAVMAQSSIDTYDVCDANLSGDVSVADATTVVNRVLANTPGSEVVTAKDLNAVLQLIDSRLSALDGRLSAIDSQLSAIQTQLGEALAKPDANGMYSNGHDYVDLGLKDSKGRPVYWATCNIGAESPEDYGLYFAWGETEGYTEDTSDGRSFYWDDYKFMQKGKSSWQNITKYTFADGLTEGIWYEGDTFVGDGKTVLEPKDDAAHVNWKGDWRMPTSDELTWLKDNCTWSWDSSKQGYTVTGTNGNSIFLPTAGYRYASSLDYAGSDGYYWSSSLSTYDSGRACCLFFDSSDRYMYDNGRDPGHSVRPVCAPSE